VQGSPPGYQKCCLGWTGPRGEVADEEEGREGRALGRDRGVGLGKAVSELDRTSYRGEGPQRRKPPRSKGERVWGLGAVRCAREADRVTTGTLGRRQERCAKVRRLERKTTQGGRRGRLLMG